MINNPDNSLNSVEEDSIDIIQLIKNLWLGRRQIIKITLIFTALGILIALLSTSIYTAKTTFIPQLGNQESSSSSIKGLASLAGIKIGGGNNGNNEISPLIYPMLAESVSFNLSLLDKTIIEKDSVSIRLDTFYLNQNKGFSLSKVFSGIKKYTIGLPSLLFSSSQDKNTENKNIGLIALNKNQISLIKQLKGNIDLSLNDKQGYVTISANDTNPIIAASLTRLVTENLQAKIIEIRLEKANDNLNFIREQYQLQYLSFTSLQNRLADFKDSNQNISTARFMSKLQRLEAEYSISFGVVQELASQVEQAEIQVNKDTPIFTVIEEIIVPSERAKPKRSQIVLIWLFLGLIISSGYLLLKDLLRDMISKITK